MSNEQSITNMKIETEFQDWGEIEYKEAWDKQEVLFNAILAQKKENPDAITSNFVVFCEHPHVYTLGKSGKEQNLLLDYIQLNAKNATFFETNRGGDITYHGPGQIVGYPIINLENFNLSLKGYINELEECVIELLKMYEIESDHMDGATGVWLDIGKPTCRKICAIGVKSGRYVTMHGFAFNVNTNLEYFSYINPCGFIDKGVTSLEKELGRKMDFDLIKSQLKSIIYKRFNMVQINE